MRSVQASEGMVLMKAHGEQMCSPFGSQFKVLLLGLECLHGGDKGWRVRDLKISVLKEGSSSGQQPDHQARPTARKYWQGFGTFVSGT